MSNTEPRNYLIEVGERPAGILIPAGQAFAFHAVEPPYAALEGVVFPDAFAAERAALKLNRQNRERRAA